MNQPKMVEALDEIIKGLEAFREAVKEPWPVPLALVSSQSKQLDPVCSKTGGAHAWGTYDRWTQACSCGAFRPKAR